MPFNFYPSAATSVQADHGHLDMQAGNEFTQRTNSHAYDATRDVVGVISSVKPQGFTTIHVTINYKTSAELAAGQWIVFGPTLAVRDWNGLPPRQFYGCDIAIGDDKPGRSAAWQHTTWTFKGFPTQAQHLQVYVVRRARTLGGDFGAVVPATQKLYVSAVLLSFGGHSTAASTPIGGYGYGYARKYGTQL